MKVTGSNNTLHKNDCQFMHHSYANYDFVRSLYTQNNEWNEVVFM